MSKKADFSWLPEELRSDLIRTRGNKIAQILRAQTHRYPKSVANSKYCLNLLKDNQAVSQIWQEVLEVDVSPLDVYWACEQPFEQSEKFKTKRMSPSRVTELESDIKKAATELRRLVQRTPVDDVFKLAGWRSDEGKLHISFSDFLETIETAEFSDYVEPEEYLRPVKKPGAKKSIRTEIILSLREVLSSVRPNRRNRLIADIVSLVIGDITSEETVKEVIKKQKRSI